MVLKKEKPMAAKWVVLYLFLIILTAALVPAVKSSKVANSFELPETLVGPNKTFIKKHQESFPGGTVVKNPPANAGDMGSSPGPGRYHMPWSN